MHYLTRLLFALAVALAFSSTAGATVYYVDKGCPLADNGNAGTDPLHPWKSISRAYTSLRAGDTVNVLAGVYPEQVTFQVSGTAAQPITYQAIPPGSVQMCGFDTSNCAYLTINGFIITPLSGFSGTVRINLNSSNVQVIGNQFLNIPNYSLWGNSFHYDGFANVANVLISRNKFSLCQNGIYISGSNWLVERNEVTRLYQYVTGSDCDYTRAFGINNVIRGNFFHGCLPAETGTAHVDGVQTYADNGDYSTNISVSGNVILDCGEGFMGENNQGLPQTGGWLFTNNIVSRTPGGAYGAAWGFDSYCISNIIISHNTVANIIWYGAGVRYSTSAAVTDNIFTNLDTACDFDYSTGITNDYNLSWQMVSSSPHGSHDKVGVDPKYANLAACNLRLTAGSPAIHAAPDGSSLGALEYPNVYYVDQQHPGASGNFFGYFGAPYQTISQAASAAQPGETVNIRAGTYRETVTIANSNTVFQSCSGETVIISGADAITGWIRNGSLWQAPLSAAPTKVLCNGATFSAYTYDAVNHLILLSAGADPRLSLYETVVRQNAVDLQGRSGVILRGLQFVNTLGPAVLPSLSTTASLDCNWVYQNTPLTTANRHNCLLTVQPGTINSYTVGLAKLSGPGHVTIQSTSNSLVWNILGGPASDGLAGTGGCVLEATVTDTVTGQVGTADVTVTVRLLGAINNAGTVTTNDRDTLAERLNGLPTPGLTDRDLDLNGDGCVTTADRVLLNRILNSLPLP
jgi:hypothetical protein